MLSSSRSFCGLSPFEARILLAVESLADGSPEYVATSMLLDIIYSETGVPPLPAYAVVCALCRRSQLRRPLLDMNGNPGDIGIEPADPTYTEVALSSIGLQVVSAERGQRHSLPIGYMMGDIHLGGNLPPLDSHRVVRAIELTRNGSSWVKLANLIGLPQFSSGCLVEGDVERFSLGLPIELMMSAVIEPDEIELGRWLVRCLPPGVTAENLVIELSILSDRNDPMRAVLNPEEPIGLPIHDIQPLTLRGGHEVVVFRSDFATDELPHLLLSTCPSLRCVRNVCLGAPLEKLVAEWSEPSASADSDLAALRSWVVS